jgi:hypothetical protein
VFKKLTLAAAAGAGYVLGAKAGKERYAQIESKFREIAGMPAVQSATSTVKEQAAPILDSAKETVGDKVASATDKVAEKAGGGKSSTAPSTPSTPSTTPPASPVAGTGATTRSTAAAGAAPSSTV